MDPEMRLVKLPAVTRFSLPARPTRWWAREGPSGSCCSGGILLVQEGSGISRRGLDGGKEEVIGSCQTTLRITLQTGDGSLPRKRPTIASNHFPAYGPRFQCRKPRSPYLRLYVMAGELMGKAGFSVAANKYCK